MKCHDTSACWGLPQPATLSWYFTATRRLCGLGDAGKRLREGWREERAWDGHGRAVCFPGQENPGCRGLGAGDRRHPQKRKQLPPCLEGALPASSSEVGGAWGFLAVTRGLGSKAASATVKPVPEPAPSASRGAWGGTTIWARKQQPPPGPGHYIASWAHDLNQVLLVRYKFGWCS